MAKVSEQISKANASMQGKTDSNLANDSNHLGGIPANEYATQEYVRKYHDEKEALQKKYIDAQDKKILEEAKEYANSQIRNQDFSSFAKVTDVQTLKKNLEEKIQKGDNDQKSYTDQKTQEIVKDTNENFKQVETAINKINSNMNKNSSNIDKINSNITNINSNINNMEGKMNNLFTSVSNGKTQIAGAITDKGVPTSATDTFSTMAGNIRNITTGSGEIPEGFVNTNDATAIASDLVLGKTAYAKGEKVFGTLIAQTEPGQPTYGLDTSDATASPGDVAAGKTFYARGQKMTGSLYDGEIEEIYGVNSDNPLYKQLIGLSDVDPITKETITKRRFLTFSKDLKYFVCMSTINEQNYIESYPKNEKGFYVIGNTNASGVESYKKYRYSMSDLGIEADETIMNIELTQKGFEGDNNKCLLVIATQQSNTNEEWRVRSKLHIYTYNLVEQGVIGKLYENQKGAIENHIEILNSGTSSALLLLAGFNLQSNKLEVLRTGSSEVYIYILTFTRTISGDLYIIKNTYQKNISRRLGAMQKCFLSSDDRYLLPFIYESWSSNVGIVFNDLQEDSNEYRPIFAELSIDGDNGISGQFVNIPGTNAILEIGEGKDCNVYEVTFDFQTDTMNITRIKYVELEKSRYWSTILGIAYFNGKIVILQTDAKYTSTPSTCKYKFFNVEDILNATDGTRIESIYSQEIDFMQYILINGAEIIGYGKRKG